MTLFPKLLGFQAAGILLDLRPPVQMILQSNAREVLYMAFDIAAHASVFLKDNKSNVVQQERHGTDCCEHFFSKFRYINSNPNMQQQRENASLASSGLGIDSEAFRPNNKGNLGTANSDVTFVNRMVPLDQPNKKRRIK